MGNRIPLLAPMRELVRKSTHNLKALLTTFAVGATDQGFIPEIIKAAKEMIGYAVIKLGSYIVLPSSYLHCIRIAEWIKKNPLKILLGARGSDGEVYYELWENGHSSPNTGATGLALLDGAVQQAEVAGIQLIVCLIK